MNIKNEKRLERLRDKTRRQIQNEIAAQIQAIQERSDFIPELDHFLEVLKYTSHPLDFREWTGSELMLALCVQAPQELFIAAGVRPFKLACGSFTAQSLVTRQLPALTCPMIKSVMGMNMSHPEYDSDQFNLLSPTTCDWVVKYAELSGINPDKTKFMELPHVREEEKAAERWLEEIFGMKKWMEKKAGNRITRKKLRQTIDIFNSAFHQFEELIELRRRHQIPAVHFAVIANAFGYDEIESWSSSLERYISEVHQKEAGNIPVYLAGSPILFPNYKLLELIENAGITVVADDICSLERSFPGPACYKDPSEYSLLRALAERNHKACICPTFADNQRRINNMVNVMEKEKISGVIFHVLKGCHPFDIECSIIEDKLKKKGYRFLKIETDYVKEDEQNIVTRLEAFRQSLSVNKN